MYILDIVCMIYVEQNDRALFIFLNTLISKLKRPSKYTPLLNIEITLEGGAENKQTNF